MRAATPPLLVRTMSHRSKGYVVLLGDKSPKGAVDPRDQDGFNLASRKVMGCQGWYGISLKLIRISIYPIVWQFASPFSAKSPIQDR